MEDLSQYPEQPDQTGLTQIEKEDLIHRLYANIELNELRGFISHLNFVRWLIENGRLDEYGIPDADWYIKFIKGGTVLKRTIEPTFVFKE